MCLQQSSSVIQLVKADDSLNQLQNFGYVIVVVVVVVKFHVSRLTVSFHLKITYTICDQ